MLYSRFKRSLLLGSNDPGAMAVLESFVADEVGRESLTSSSGKVIAQPLGF